MLITGANVKLTPAVAWQQGTNIQKAMRQNPSLIRGWVMAEIGKLCKEIDAKTTISNDQELIFCTDAILEDYPTLKLEELKACFDMVRKGKFGKLYERLKTPEILEFLCRYEGEQRTPILEQQIHQQKIEHQKAVTDNLIASPIKEVVKSLKDNSNPTKGEGVGSRLRKQFNDEA